MVDLDRFKAVNDTFGHDAGDGVLRRTADALRAAIRGADVAGRWGGEEFLLLLPHTDRGGGLHVADRIRAAVSEPATVANHTVSVTASIGLAVFSDGDARGLISAADAALYEAKAAGRDRTVVATDRSPAPSSR